MNVTEASRSMELRKLRNTISLLHLRLVSEKRDGWLIPGARSIAQDKDGIQQSRNPLILKTANGPTEVNEVVPQQIAALQGEVDDTIEPLVPDPPFSRSGTGVKPKGMGSHGNPTLVSRTLQRLQDVKLSVSRRSNAPPIGAMPSLL